MSQFHDSAERYGLVSRVLHWAMAALLGWQFFTTLVRVLMEDSDLDKFAWGTHRAVGVTLMGLIVIRLAWSWFSRKQRPASLSLAARLGHLGLYALMLVVPMVALMRQYGSGRELNVFGVSLMPGFDGEKIEWLMAPASLLHGNLGWLLLAMIIGHAAMAFIHRRQAGGVDVLARMVGRAS